MLEPTATAFGGNSAGRIVKRYFRATRPRFFQASGMPVLIGSSLGYLEAGNFDLVACLLAVMATLLVHAGSNVTNDVFDDLTGNDAVNTDRIFPYSGGSRIIQNGVLSRSQMARWAVVLLSVGVVAGLVLTLLKGPAVICFGLIGIILGIGYSLPVLRLSARGLGEVVIGINFGILPVVGAAWLQTGNITTEAFLVALPVCMWVMAILLINEVPDANADESVGRRTWVVRTGLGGTRGIYLLLNVAAFMISAYLSWQGILPWWGFALPVLLMANAYKASLGILAARRDRTALQVSIENTLRTHALGSVWLIALIVWQAA